MNKLNQMYLLLLEWKRGWLSNCWSLSVSAEAVTVFWPVGSILFMDRHLSGRKWRTLRCLALCCIVYHKWWNWTQIVTVRRARIKQQELWSEYKRHFYALLVAFISGQFVVFFYLNSLIYCRAVVLSLLVVMAHFWMFISCSCMH